MHTDKKSGKAMFAIPKSNKPNQTFKQKEKIIMSSKNTNKLNVPEARAAMNKFKMEAASEVDVQRPQKKITTYTAGNTHLHKSLP